ncbi:helix-turn-helix domain-containing protein [Modestobacter sp. VKM Ac-2979]|nr:MULTISPECIES: helix-turn-helix domain-containing protein [unclassified Modestobacter]MCZ2811294.1 helix-turn-helix domain-containing protein [Modestobacter sp. VKM Ac-2979]MCZ2840807.1 helix-turn-helix domain-containing protein [Modestobacter sp. VKM Ac-2980]
MPAVRPRPRQSAPVFLTVPELAARWSATDRTLRRMVDSGDLPVTRIGRSVRYRLSDVLDYEAEHSNASL